MAVVTRGRILRGAPTSAPAIARATSDASDIRGPRRVAKPIVDASLAARRITNEALRIASDLTAQARAGAAAEIERAKNEVCATEVARLAGGFLALKVRGERRAEDDLDRVVALSVMLAERLVSSAIDAVPTRVLAMARASLAEARGARRAMIEAHPLDVETLTTHLDSLGLPKESLDVRINPELARGELCLHTDLGTLDARLKPQLERLADALRDALRSP